MHYLYIVFSSTPYKLGKAIRKVTGTTYNHVSVALDGELSQMYGFARRNFHYPLYGGFVRESLARYHLEGQSSQVKICRVPVSTDRFQEIKNRLQEMEENKEQYLYNFLSLLGMPFKRPVPVKDAFICVEFAVDVLENSGFPLPRRGYYRISDLEEILDAYTVYTGALHQGEPDPGFYSRELIPHPYFSTFKGFVALFPRLQF